MSAQLNQNTTGSSGSCTGNAATATTATTATNAAGLAIAKVNQTQGTSNTTAVVANGASGTLTMFAALAGEEVDTFTFTNSSIVPTSKIFLQVRGTTAAGIPPIISAGTPGSGSTTINVYNPSALAQSAATLIDYIVNV